MTDKELAKLLYRIADLVRLAARVSELPTCNDCAIQTACKIRPEWGDEVRYNCPLWQMPDKEEEENES